MRPSGIVFDLDGTLILSHHDFGRMRVEIVKTAEGYGVPPGRLAVDELIGTTQVLDAARRELMAAGVPEEAILRFHLEVNRGVDAIEMEALRRTTTRRGAEELLRDLSERAFRLGLFTRSSEGFCQAALTQTGLRQFFPYTRTRTEPGPAKPSPEALHLLLEKMDVPVGRALFVGDHLEDSRCATRAGVTFYGVLPDPDQPNPTTAEQFLASGAAAVAANLEDVGRLINGATTDGRRSRPR